MSYTALYRKFRPDTFDEVKGQDPIVTTLKNQIKHNRVGHAYLFCGTRGTGKTTAAKILAKVVNCENPQDGNPCNLCEMCQAIMDERSLNVIEIDAASNNGVDNIREIVEEVRYSPNQGRYKVYIIDEVHMLSTGAFNALLKTLEEPPPYIIFILATTEVHKIPITILSRCQRFDFKRITVDIITKRLIELTQIEKVEVEEKALRYIATMADGALRDALSLLDQCMSYYLDETLTYDKVLNVLGAVDTKVFSKLIMNINKEDISACIILIDEMEDQGRELGRFVIDFIWYLRNLLLVRISDDAVDILEISTENLERLKEDSEIFEGEDLIRFIGIFSELSNQIKYANRKKILIEVALIKLCRPQMEENYDSLIARIKNLEKRVEKGLILKPDMGERGGPTSGTLQKEQIKEKEVFLPEALPEDLKKVVEKWPLIIGKTSEKSELLSNYLKNSTLSIGGDGELVVISGDEMAIRFINTDSSKENLQEIVEAVIKKQVKITSKYLSKENQIAQNIPDLTEIIKAPIEYVD